MKTAFCILNQLDAEGKPKLDKSELFKVVMHFAADRKASHENSMVNYVTRSHFSCHSTGVCSACTKTHL